MIALDRPVPLGLLYRSDLQGLTEDVPALEHHRLSKHETLVFLFLQALFLQGQPGLR